MGSGATGRRELPTSAHAVLALLTMGLVAAFVWWRLSEQRRRVESYWTLPLAGSATLYRVRADEWLTAHRRTAEVLGALAARGHGPGSAFELALGSALADRDVPFVTIRDGSKVTLCRGVPLATACESRPGEFDIPSPSHPQARRVRELADGRVLVPIAAPIASDAQNETGVLVMWMDPEKSLLPRLLRTRGSIVEAHTVFVRYGDDSTTMLTREIGSGDVRRQRFGAAALPPLFAGTALDSSLVSGFDENGAEALAAHVYIPRLRWRVYRVLPRTAAVAPFRSELVTEGALAFILGSFVIGLVVWTIRGRREQRVRAELLQVRLDSLQAQLRPHFLFNALNTIATLVHEDADAAEAMLVRLADLLRLSLEHADDAEIPLRSEIEIFDAYIAVERVRFGEALRVDKSIADDALDVPVPRWILQPLAENAIKHGAAYTRGAIAMALTATRDDSGITITLADDGPLLLDESAREGIGLRNTRHRLASLYGDRARLSLRARPEGGTEATVRIPVPPELLRLDTAEHEIGEGLRRRALSRASTA